MPQRLIPLNKLLFLVVAINTLLLVVLAGWLLTVVNEGRMKNTDNLNFAEKAAKRNEILINQLTPLALQLTELAAEIEAFAYESELFILDPERASSRRTIQTVTQRIAITKDKVMALWPSQLHYKQKQDFEENLLITIDVGEEFANEDSPNRLLSIYEYSSELADDLKVQILAVRSLIDELFQSASKAGIESARYTESRIENLDSLLAQFKGGSLLILSVVFIISLGSQFFLLHKVRTRLKLLKKYAGEIEGGQYHSEKPFHSSDYTGELVDSIQSMSLTLVGLLERSKKLTSEALAAARSKSEFLANMSHEIRTPMNAIMGFTELLSLENLTRQQKDYVNRILSSTKSLLTIINEILDFSKLEAGKMQLNAEPLKPQQLLEDQLVLFSQTACEKNLEFIYRVSPEIPSEIIGDRERLGQVLTNLVGNAFKFTHEGFVELSLAVNDRIDSQISLRFSVRDSGIGIGKENLSAIFSAFNQEDASTTRRYGGTGLGLSISQNLVKLMGGSIEVESQIGKGSCFSFSVVMRTDYPCQTTFSQNVVKNHDQDKKVIIGYRHPRAIEAYTQQFELAGADCLPCQSINEIRSAIRQRPESIVVIEAQLLGQSSPEEQDSLWVEHKEQLPINLVANSDIDLENLNISTFGAYCVYKKPLMPSDLESILGPKPAIPSQLLKDSADNSNEQSPVKYPELSVLVADDVENNRLLAEVVLNSLAITPVLVSNGREAVNAASQQHFDLILMDLQMPEMDGDEATRLIRKASQSTDSIIVALTAKIFAEDKRQSMEAGMDDFLTKPFKLEQLASVLGKWFPGKAITDESSTSIDKEIAGKPADAITSDDPCNLPVVDVQKGIRQWLGQESLYHKSLFSFTQDNQDLGQRLQQLVKDQEYEDAGALAHSIRGQAGTLCIPALQDATKLFEDSLGKVGCDHHLRPDLEASLLDIKKAIARLCEFVQCYEEHFARNTRIALSSSQDAKDESPDAQHGQLEKLINDLYHLINQSDTGAFSACNQLQSMLIEYPESHNKINRLMQALDQFEFNEAKNTLEDLSLSLNLCLEEHQC